MIANPTLQEYEVLRFYLKLAYVKGGQNYHGKLVGDDGEDEPLGKHKSKLIPPLHTVRNTPIHCELNYSDGTNIPILPFLSGTFASKSDGPSLSSINVLLLSQLLLQMSHLPCYT